MTIIQKIERTKSELSRVKPRSYRRVELETRLRDLVVRQIRQELRAEKRN